jgi:hypothetical protein
VIQFLKRSIANFLDTAITPLVRYVISSSTLQTRLLTAQADLRREMDALRDRMRTVMPDNPCLYGFKVYSQVDEDGILQNIFSRIPQHKRTFIEIGCGNGIENNTHFLALQGYKGCWLDGDATSIASIESALGGLRFPTLLVQKKFVTLENIGQILAEHCSFLGSGDIGLFSLDIDGNDLAIMAEAIKHISPQVICAEYNARFPPPIAVSTRYDPIFTWQSDDYHGASLQAFCELLSDYQLVCCNLCGSNAFFVRVDLAKQFQTNTSVEIYQPLRMNLTQLQSGHAATLKWLQLRLHNLELGKPLTETQDHSETFAVNVDKRKNG